MDQAIAIPSGKQVEQAWPLRVLPSFTDLAFLVPILFLFAGLRGAKTLLGDGDTGWHVRTGEWIAAHGAVPHTDFFSFSKPGQPWFAWEWGWDVIFAWIHDHAGLAGVVFVNVVLLGVVSALLFRLARRYTENDVLSILLTSLAMAVSSIHWLARPHLLGWVFLLGFCHIVCAVRAGRTRLLWVTPFLMVLWTNIHGSFFIGIALLAANAAGDAMRGWLFRNGEGRALELRRASRFAWAAAGCAAATVVNPYGIGLHRHVFRYLFDTRQLEKIGEYQSISFHSPMAACLEILLFLGAGAIFWCWRTKQLEGVLILGAWAHLALVSSRNIPIYVLLATPYIAGMAQDVASRSAVSSAGVIRALARRFRDLGAEYRALERVGRLHVASGLSVVALALLFAAPMRPQSFVAEYDRRDYPAAALKVLRAKTPSRIFTDDEWGDYLIYNLYPEYRVFIDGRSDFYGADFDQTQIDLINARHDWQAQLSRFSIDTVLLRADTPLAGVLKESRNWTLVYDDGIATIFRAVAPRSRLLGAGVAAQPMLSSVSPDVGKRLAALPAAKPEAQTWKSKQGGRRNS